MKSVRRSIVSRTSTSVSTHRIPPSVPGHGKSVPPPSRISRYKWMEIRNEENANHIVNSIREEIVQRAMDILYKDYLIKGSCSFVVSCAHTAWSQLFNWMYLKRDPGESPSTVKERWIGDEEHSPVPMDNWSFGNVEIRKKSSSQPEQKVCEEICEQEDISRILPENMTLPSPQESSVELNETAATKIVSTSNEVQSTQPAHQQDNEENAVDDETAEGGEQELPTVCEAGESSDRSEVLSIFTRTIGMPEQELPIPRWLSGQNQPAVRGSDAFQRKNRRSSKLNSVKAPRKLSLDRLPADRA